MTEVVKTLAKHSSTQDIKFSSNSAKYLLNVLGYGILVVLEKHIMENRKIEWKRVLTDDFEKKAVAYLNSKDGGHLYIGIEDDGSVVGVDDIDDIQKRAAQRLGSNILPVALGLYDIEVEKRGGKDIVHIIFASGPQKPYYISQFGMSPKGCYMRDGAIAVPMPTEMIERLYVQRLHPSLSEAHSPSRQLTFEQLKYSTRLNTKRLIRCLRKRLNLSIKTANATMSLT